MAARNAYASTSGNGMDHAAPFAWALGRLALMLRAMATRRQLARLDERALKDIGLSRTQALAEASRLPWDVGPRR